MGVAGNFWGDLVRDLRKKQRLSQRELAIRADVNRSTLRSIEGGLSCGDIGVIEKLLNYLGYELEDLEREAVDERLRRQARDEVDPDRRSTLALQRFAAMFTPLTEPS